MIKLILKFLGLDSRVHRIVNPWVCLLLGSLVC